MAEKIDPGALVVVVSDLATRSCGGLLSFRDTSDRALLLFLTVDFLSSIGNTPISDRSPLGPALEGALVMTSTDEVRTTGGKGARRREAKIASIVEAAWGLSNEEGGAALSLHGLARKVGMRQPSLYEYFDSKNALYDAMFADGNRQLLARLETITFPRDPRAALKKYLSTFITFALEDPARWELLFQRPLPSFTPSLESYALAEQVLDHLNKLALSAGVTDHGDADCL